LRARLGDVIELTFLNQIDPAVSPIHRPGGEARRQRDRPKIHRPVATSAIPAIRRRVIRFSIAGNPQFSDKFPDCFHGSSTGNIHFHGTHTNPNGRATIVLLEIRPSPLDPASKKPLITGRQRQEAVHGFLSLPAKRACWPMCFRPYPQTWDDKRSAVTTAVAWTADQAKLLQGL